MDQETARPSTGTHRAGLRLAFALAVMGLLCSALPSGAAAARPSSGPAVQHAIKLARHDSSDRLLAGVRLLADGRILAVTGHASRPARASALPSTGASLCVGKGAGCFATIQAALDAAHDGDTIHLGAGTFAGGITIAKSIRLVGAGAKASVIRGGGSVVTIGTLGAALEPTVTISGVTITGGITRSSPESAAFFGVDGVFALGGGVEIPPSADSSGGTTVTITNSVITGNRVAPAQTLPGPPCPDGPCPFALAAGGGIDNWGTLTLVNTTVSDNRVGTASGLSDLASDADGGGIMSWQGALTVIDSTISGNRVSATAPNGRFAEGGGMFPIGGSLTMRGSSVTDNHVSLAASLPDTVDLAANSGGIHIGGEAPDSIRSTIRRSIISGNSVSMTNTVGYASAFSGGLHTDVDVELRDDVIADNSVTVATLAGSSSFAVGDSGAGEILSGTITGTRFSGNRLSVTSAAGDAFAIAGGVIFRGSVAQTVFSDNHVTATSPDGMAFAAGGGLIEDFGGVTLRDTAVSRNTVRASGLSGSAEGGGIFDAAIEFGPPGGPLTLTRSVVTRNVVSGSPAINIQGGGVFTDNVVTIVDSVISKNTPDQCVGC